MGNADRTSISLHYQPVSRLRLNSNNPRIHSRGQINQIAESIRVFGFNVPILVKPDGDVIAGHGRLLACKQLGITEVPTIALEHLNEAQARAFMIADNRLTENASWDDQLLAEQFKTLADADLDFSLEATGFQIGEIDLMIEGFEPAAEESEDLADVIASRTTDFPITQSGDLWLLGKHRVLCADATQEGSYTLLMNGRQASSVFIDPPYNVLIEGHAIGNGKIHHGEFRMASGEMTEVEFAAFLKKIFTLLCAHSTKGSIHYICMDWRHLGEVFSAGRQTYSDFKNLCVWAKDNAGMGSFYRSQHELVFVFKNGSGQHRNNIQLGQYGRYRSNVWSYPGVNSFARNTPEGNLLEMHPTVKPVALVADAILDCSARGEIVLDAFLGSGTSVVAAERTGRICYGMEIEPVYVDTIVRRWQAFTGEVAVNSETGQTFSEREEAEIGVRQQ